MLNKERQYKLEAIILQLLRKINTTTTEADFLILIAELQLPLEQLAEDSFEKRVFAYFDFRAWVVAKIDEKNLVNLNG